MNAFSRVEAFERARGRRYDVVVRLRSDVLFREPLDFGAYAAAMRDGCAAPAPAGAAGEWVALADCLSGLDMVAVGTRAAMGRFLSQPQRQGEGQYNHFVVARLARLGGAWRAPRAPAGGGGLAGAGAGAPCAPFGACGPGVTSGAPKARGRARRPFSSSRADEADARAPPARPLSLTRRSRSSPRPTRTTRTRQAAAARGPRSCSPRTACRSSSTATAAGCATRARPAARARCRRRTRSSSRGAARASSCGSSPRPRRRSGPLERTRAISRF